MLDLTHERAMRLNETPEQQVLLKQSTPSVVSCTRTAHGTRHDSTTLCTANSLTSTNLSAQPKATRKSRSGVCASLRFCIQANDARLGPRYKTVKNGGRKLVSEARERRQTSETTSVGVVLSLQGLLRFPPSLVQTTPR